MRIWLHNINYSTLRHDFWAGITGATIAIPQAIAFSLIAGLPPEFGLYSVIIVQLIAGFLGASWHMISGPTVALSIILVGTLGHYAPVGSIQYINLSLTLMFLVGVIQIGLSIFKLGSVVNFISHTVIIGFTAGAGILIILNQLPVFLGITINTPSDFIDKWVAIFQQLPSIYWPNLLVACTTLLCALGIQRHGPRMPYLLIGIAAGTLVYFLLGRYASNIAHLSPLPHKLPHVKLPISTISELSALFPSAVAVALIGLIEAVSIARAIAINSKQPIDANKEFFGQGLSNLVGSCFSCYVSSGSFNRSAINYYAGAKTPLSSLFTALIVVILLYFAPTITNYLPMPAIASTIILSSYRLIDWKQIFLVAQSSRSEFIIIIITFISTLLFSLEFAIYIGVILSLIHYLQHTSHPRLTLVDFSTVPLIFTEGEQPTTIATLRVDGSLFFGAVEHVRKAFITLLKEKEYQHVVLLTEGVNIIDIAGCELLVNLRNQQRNLSGDIYLIGVKPHLRKKLQKTPYWRLLGGKHNIFESTYVAFRTICKNLKISNYRALMKHLFRDYNKL